MGLFFSKPKKDIVIEEPQGKENFEIKTVKGIQQRFQAPQQKLIQAKLQQTNKENVGVLSISQSDASDWMKAKGQLVVDVYKTDEEFCLQAPVAGVEPSDISVGIERQMLVISGKRQAPDQDKQKQYTYQECFWGPFARQIILPDDVDTSQIKASLKKGILTIRIPRPQKDKKQVKISLED